MTQLTGNQLKQLQEALLAAFNQAELEWLLRSELDVMLSHIAPARAAFSEIVFAVIRWAESHGRIGELVAAAQSERPLNTQITALRFDLADSGNSGSTSALDRVKRTALQQRLKLLLEEYQAVINQLGYALDASQRVRLQRQADSVEKEIKAVEAELAQLDA